MVQYTVLTAEDIIDLTNKVNNYVKNGWLPQGGIAIYKGGSLFERDFFAQAMLMNTK